MGLKVELKPGERIIVGDSLIVNGDRHASLVVEGKAPILRERDVMTSETADTPAKRVYLVVQMMYLTRDVETYRDEYFDLIDQFVRAAPSTLPIVDEINNRILTGQLYKALRETKLLVEREQEILTHASRIESV